MATTVGPLFVGSNANISVTVPQPAVGDLMLITWEARAGLMEFVQPAGWTAPQYVRNEGGPLSIGLTYKTYAAGDSLSHTLTRTGASVSGATIIAVALVITDISTVTMGTAASSGATASNTIVAPSVSWGAGDSILALFAWSNDYSGGINPPLGTSQHVATSSTTGNDASFFVLGRGFTNAGSGTFSLTANTSAPGLGVQVVLGKTVAPTGPRIGGTRAFTGSGTLSAQAGTKTGGMSATPPATILNLGTGSGQNHFVLQYAPDGASDITTKSLAELVAGFADPVHFFTTGDNWVQFSPRADGPTTSGTSFARDELREVDAAGNNYKFNALVGEHIFEGETRIVSAPSEDPDVVVAQLHNGDEDRIAIRTQMFSNGTVVLGARINGTLESVRFENPYTFNTAFKWKIRLNNGVVEIYYNDMTTPLIVSNELTQTTHPDGWYWKTGAYNQFNGVASGATDLVPSSSARSVVQLRNLSNSHGTTVLDNAGADQTVAPWSIVTLSGTGVGPWSQTAGTSVTLNGSGSTRTFSAPPSMANQSLAFAYGSDSVVVTVNAAKNGIVSGGSVVPIRFVTVGS